MAKKGTIWFLIFAILWEIAVCIIYGLFLSYNQDSFANMQSITTIFTYQYTSSSTTKFKTNSSQFPFPLTVVAIAIILLVVGFSMIAGYIESSSRTGMAFTLLIFALTIQNFFIFRDFWNRIGINNSKNSINFSTRIYPFINYINYGNDLQNNYQLPSASFLDAVGASLAIYAGYTAVIGRIGLGQIFILSWIGTFIYQLNSQILWRLYIPDNGYPSRAFAFGGIMGLISSLILGKRDKTVKSTLYRSSYRIMAIAFIGIIFVWCTFPILVLSNVYTSVTGKVVAMVGQVNIWLALASSLLGCLSATSLAYKKFCIHDILFSSITGAIAFSSSTDLNYNPGAATTIGFTVGFLMSISQSRFKKSLNSSGIVDSNSVLFNFILPSFFAAIFSAVMEGIGQTATNYTATTYNTTTTNSSSNTTFNTTSIAYSAYLGSGRDQTSQGGYQIIGWIISIGFGALSGLIIGMIYRLLNVNFQEITSFFNDATIFDLPQSEKKKINQMLRNQGAKFQPAKEQIKIV